MWSLAIDDRNWHTAETEIGMNLIVGEYCVSSQRANLVDTLDNGAFKYMSVISPFVVVITFGRRLKLSRKHLSWWRDGWPAGIREELRPRRSLWCLASPF